MKKGRVRAGPIANMVGVLLAAVVAVGLTVAEDTRRADQIERAAFDTVPSEAATLLPNPVVTRTVETWTVEDLLAEKNEQGTETLPATIACRTGGESEQSYYTDPQIVVVTARDGTGWRIDRAKRKVQEISLTSRLDALWPCGQEPRLISRRE